MSISFGKFDRDRLTVRSLTERHHNLDLTDIQPLRKVMPVEDALKTVANRIKTAKHKGAAVILMMGAHVLRAGVQEYLIDLMERGFISCIAANGAGIIHDYEFALIGATTESVAHYIKDGSFGLWQETGRINDIVKQAADAGSGLGEAIGKAIAEGDFPHKEISIFAAGYRLGIPMTVHVGIGYDIVHEHPNCDGAAWGKTSYLDFLRFAKIMENLEGGVIMNFGSAVMGPEVYLKALAMARNAARHNHGEIRRFSTLVCDLLELPTDFRAEPARDTPAYYFRPWKTMLVRTVAEGGESYYVRGNHKTTIPQLWTALSV